MSQNIGNGKWSLGVGCWIRLYRTQRVRSPTLNWRFSRRRDYNQQICISFLLLQKRKRKFSQLRWKSGRREKLDEGKSNAEPAKKNRISPTACLEELLLLYIYISGTYLCCNISMNFKITVNVFIVLRVIAIQCILQTKQTHCKEA